MRCIPDIRTLRAMDLLHTAEVILKMWQTGKAEAKRVEEFILDLGDDDGDPDE